MRSTPRRFSADPVSIEMGFADAADTSYIECCLSIKTRVSRMRANIISRSTRFFRAGNKRSARSCRHERRLLARVAQKERTPRRHGVRKKKRKKKEKGKKEEKKKGKERKSIAAARYVAHRSASGAARANQITVNSAEKDRPGELIVSFISRLASLVGGEITALARRIDPSSPKYRRTRSGITL